VWTVDGGRLKRRVVSFGHRTEDARLEIVDMLPAGVEVVTKIDAAMREGRAARAIREAQQ
jgi:HlyD family secretion protein